MVIYFKRKGKIERTTPRGFGFPFLMPFGSSTARRLMNPTQKIGSITEFMGMKNNKIRIFTWSDMP